MRHRESNYYANCENQFYIDSSSPTTPTPEGLNHIDINKKFLNTQAVDPISTQAQVPSSTQAPIVSDTHLPLIEFRHLVGQARLERERLYLNFTRIIWHTR